jgi:uncharacterized protein involved in outer membrane biogenesis
MKKFLLVLVILFLMGIVGIAVFLITFDADRYRPLAEERLTQALGRPVSIERLGLGWSGGVAAQVHGLRIAEDATGQVAPLLEVERINVVLSLMPLLRKQVAVQSVVVIRPRARIFRDVDGRVNLVGAAGMAAPAAAPSQAQAQGAPVAFRIDTVRLEDGVIQWTDRMARPPMALSFEKLDAVLRDVTAGGLAFEVRVAAFSHEQNLTVEGRATLPGAGRTGAVAPLRLELNLAAMQPQALQQAFPNLRLAAMRQGLAGELIVAAERVPLDPALLPEAAATLTLEGGKLALPSMASPIEALSLEAAVQGDRIHLSRCTGSLASGKFSVRGVVESLLSRPRADVDLSVERLSLAGLMPVPSGDAPHLRGLLSLAFKGTGQGMAWPDIAASLSGSGRLRLDDGALANVNVVRLVFEQLSVLPGVVDRLQAKLPAVHRERLNQRDTVLRPIDQALAVSGGSAVLQDLHLETDLAALDGTLTLSLLTPTVSGRPMLAIEPELSAAIVSDVHELQALLDAQGRVSLPVVVQWPSQPPVVPDLQYVISRVVVTKTEDLIRDALQRYLQPESDAQPQPSDPALTPPPQP